MSVSWATLRGEPFPPPFLQLLKGMEISQKWTGVANLTGKAGVILSSFTSPSPPIISIISDVPMFMHQIRHVAHATHAGPILWRKQLSSPGNSVLSLFSLDKFLEI